MRKNKTWFEVIRTIVAIAVSLLLALIIILAISNEPGNALKSFLLGPLTSVRHFGNVIEMAIPLTFAGLAVSVMFQAKQFNMGAEGSFLIGATAAAIVAIKAPLPPVILPIAAILVGAIIGGAANFIPAILKSKWNASELVSSLMLNYILLYLSLYLINYYFRDPNAGAMVSTPFRNGATLPNIIPGTRIHLGLLIAIAMIFITYYFLYRTKWGYEIRTTGLNQRFAEYSGINVAKVILYSQIIGGVIAGIGGATEMLGMYTKFQWQATPGYGWDGIIVAILARNNPALVPLGAFFLSFLRIGADIMARYSDVPAEVVSIIQGIMIMLIAAESFLATWRHRMIVKGATESKDKKVVKGAN